MADRPGSGSGESPADSGAGSGPDYGWLYGDERAERPPAGPGPRPAGDPEPTRMLPTLQRPGAQPRPATTPEPVTQPMRGGAPPAAPPRAPVRPVPPPGASPAGRPRRRRGVWFWVRVALLLWLVFLVAVPFWAWSRIDKVADVPGGKRPAEQPGTTYLLVGSDSRAGLTRKQELDLGTGKAEGRRTDTIMLLHTGSGPNLLLSIPRDSLVAIPGHGTTKINAAFAYGGPRLLMQTIEQDTGIRVDDYIEIGFAGFVGAVDAVGGITICPTQAMKDPLANLDIHKGCQQADGKTALGYARSRHVEALGDIARAQHQREVVSAVGSKAVSPWTVLNPLRYVRLAKAGSTALRVGKHTGMLATLKFAWAMTHVNGSNGLTCSVPISDLAVHWDSQRAPALFSLIAHDHTDNVPKRLCTPSGLPSG